MNSRVWLNVGLLGLVLVLGLVVWYESMRPPPEAPPALTQLKPVAVNKIEIFRRNHDHIILTGQGGQWWMSEPVHIAANTFQVENILHVLSADSLAEFPAVGKELAAYGLAQPEVRVRFNDVEVAFGGMAPVDQRRYVLVDHTVHLITDMYALDLEADVPAFASRALVPEPRQIVALSLPDFSLVKDEDGRWHATPESKFASADAMQAVLDAWRNAQAIRVSLYQQEPTQGEVTIKLAGQDESLRYLIVKQDKEGVLARPDVGLEFQLSGEQMDRLLGRTPKDADGKQEKGAAAAPP